MPAVTDLPTIDRTALEDIRQALDSAAVRRLADIYADTARQLCAQIRAAQSHGRINEMKHAAHSLKGGSQQMCAMLVAESARAIEEACNAGRPQDVAATVGELAGLLDRTLLELRTLVAAP
jgi:chemotaxis protein histidine kinase CheA